MQETSGASGNHDTSSPGPETSQINQQFLSLLHRGGTWRYLWFSPGRKSDWFSYDKSIPALPKTTHNVYFGVHPVQTCKRPYERSTIEEVAAINCVFAEVDAKDFAQPGEDVESNMEAREAAKKKAWEHIQKLGLAPSVVIDSAGGFHAYWLLETPFRIETKAQREQAKSLQKRWVETVGGDGGAKDLARILRLPGTHNYKYSPPGEVKYIVADLDRRYALEKLEAFLPVAPSEKPVRKQTTTTLPDRHDEAVMVLAKNDIKFQRLFHGDITEYNEDESRADEAFCFKVAFYTKDPAQIDRLYRRSSLYRPKWDEVHYGNGETYGEHAINEALKKVTASCSASQGGTIQPRSRRPQPPQEGEEVTPHPADSPEILPSQRGIADLQQALSGMQNEKPDAIKRFLMEKDFSGDAAELSRVERLLLFEDLKALGISQRWLNEWEKALKELHSLTREEAVEGLTKQLSDAIVAEDAFALDTGKRLYVHRDGVYQNTGESYLRSRVKVLLDDWNINSEWSKHRTDEVVEYIRVDAPSLPDRPPADRINVKNGLLHIATKELTPHDPGFLSMVQFPIVYDPSATCPTWDQLFKDVLPEDAYEAGVGYEIAASLLVPHPSHQKAINLIGEGSNGKSTLIRGLIHFIGRRNVAGLSLQKMEMDKFAAARLVGKMANMCPDLPSTHLTETGVFKAITGGDHINCEYKFGESFEYYPFCRLIFSANHPPRSSDSSFAFFRRWVVIPFTRTFETTDPGYIPSKELDALLSDPCELSGLLNKALEVLPRWLNRGYTETVSMQKAWNEFRQVTDPLSVWLDQNTIEDPEMMVPREALLKAYNDYARKLGIPVMTPTSFGIALGRIKKLESKQRTVAGKLVWVLLGIGLKSEFDAPTSQSSQRSQPSLYYKQGEKTHTECEKEPYIDRGKGVNPVNVVNENPLEEDPFGDEEADATEEVF